jgi:MFS family permease
MATEQSVSEGDKRLFWACFLALIATAFGFIVRSMIIDTWGVQFGLSETEKGQIIGAGLWPFALTIVLFSLVIDSIGYGRAMAFAFVCHIASAAILITAKGYTALYWGSFIGALGNGTVEAVINPVVATMFHREKTKWLNMLHAGWPGGLVIGGLMTLALGQDSDWHYKVAIIFIPVIGYGIMMLGKKFPVHERVAAGVSYQAMLKEVGAIGALIVIALMTFEVGRTFEWSNNVKYVIIAVLTIGYGVYVRSLGRPLFIFLLFIMMPLATTELGTDSWITDLMAPEMAKLNLQAGWVLVYTSFIMMLLRFCAGPIVHKLSPLGLLAASAAIAAVGLVALSKSAGIGILLAATLYGFGKTFFWPTMLGVVAERFPKGGALTLNSIAGVGMLSVGIVGAVFLGYFQDSSTDKQLAAYDAQNKTDFHSKYVTLEKTSIFGKYVALDADKVKAAPDADKAVLTETGNQAKKGALMAVAIFPCIMLVCYLILIGYFKSQGGYNAIHMDEAKHT